MLRNLLMMLICLVLVSGLSACGKTGKLYLPDDKPAANKAS